jgi:hypothetical protein
MTQNVVIFSCVVRLRSMRWSRSSTSGSTLTTWSVQIRRRCGTGPSDRTFRALADAVDQINDTNRDISDAVREIGFGLGSAGHELTETTDWFGDLLAVVPRRQRDRLGRWEYALDLVEGWLAGATAQDRHADGGVDGVELLRYRLHQHYDRCHALGINAADVFALVVVDLGQPVELDPFTRQLANDQLNDALSAEFRCGETFALFDHGRAVVLCDRRGELAGVVGSLVNALCLAVGPESSPHGWVEPLPLDRFHVWALVAELAEGAGHVDIASVSATIR